MEILKRRTQPNINVKFHDSVPLCVTQYICINDPSKLNDSIHIL